MQAIAAFVSLAALAVAAPVSAQQATPPPIKDLSQQDATALARFAMPEAFAGLQQRCDGVLGSDAFIKTDGDKFTKKLQNEARDAWPAARTVVIRLASKGDPQISAILSQMPPQSLQPFVGEYVAGLVNSHVATDKCTKIDKVISLLAPLPADNLAQLAGMVLVQAQSQLPQQAGADQQPAQAQRGFGP